MAFSMLIPKMLTYIQTERSVYIFFVVFYLFGLSKLIEPNTNCLPFLSYTRRYHAKNRRKIARNHSLYIVQKKTLNEPRIFKKNIWINRIFILYLTTRKLCTHLVYSIEIFAYFTIFNEYFMLA